MEELQKSTVQAGDLSTRKLLDLLKKVIRNPAYSLVQDIKKNQQTKFSGVKSNVLLYVRQKTNT